MTRMYMIDTSRLQRIMPELVRLTQKDLSIKVGLLQALGLTEREIGMVLIDKIWITPDGNIVDTEDTTSTDVEALTTVWGDNNVRNS